MMPSRPARRFEDGLRARFAVWGGGAAFGLVLLSGLVTELLGADPQASHLAFSLVLSLLAGGIGAWLGHGAARFVAEPLDALHRALESPGRPIAPQALPQDAPAEIGELARDVAAMARAFAQAQDGLAAAAARIHGESLAIHQAASRRSAQAETEAASLDETHALAAEIAEATQRTIGQADSVIQLSQQAEELGADGARGVAGTARAAGALAEQVQRLTAMVAELSERTAQIGEIVVTVQDLAEQTDLVALNASVEAAKAGEQGRGFAVVAMEMRQLAEQSRQSATQVRSILAEIDQGTQSSAAATEEGMRRAQEAQHMARSASETLEGLVGVIRSAGDAARQIAEAARHQAGDFQSMLSSFGHVVRALNAGAEEVRELERSAKSLADLSRALAERAGGGAPPAGPGAAE